MIEYELMPIHDNAKSFYRKARVRMLKDVKQLISYETLVADVSKGEAHVHNVESATTLRHVKEFLKQEGFKAENKAQISGDYMR